MMKKNIIVHLYNINKYYNVLQSSRKECRVSLFAVSLAIAYLEVQIEGGFPHGITIGALPLCPPSFSSCSMDSNK